MLYPLDHDAPPLSHNFILSKALFQMCVASFIKVLLHGLLKPSSFKIFELLDQVTAALFGLWQILDPNLDYCLQLHLMT